MMVMSPMCCYFTHQHCSTVVRLEAHRTNCMFSWKSKLPGLELKEELRKKNRSFPSRHERTWTSAGLHSWACWPYQQQKCIPSTFRSGTELLPPQLTRSHPLQRHRGSTFPEHTPHSQIFTPRTPPTKNSHLLLPHPTVMQTEWENLARRHKVIFLILALCADGGPTQTCLYSGTAPTLTQSESICGFSYQIPNVWLSAVSQWKERSI